MLIDHMPEYLHNKILATNTEKMTKIMDLMKVRIHFYKDMLNHQYLFTEPDYNTEIAKNFQAKVKLPKLI
jgi:hypothetical protein